MTQIDASTLLDTKLLDDRQRDDRPPHCEWNTLDVDACDTRSAFKPKRRLNTSIDMRVTALILQRLHICRTAYLKEIRSNCDRSTKPANCLLESNVIHCVTRSFHHLPIEWTDERKITLEFPGNTLRDFARDRYFLWII